MTRHVLYLGPASPENDGAWRGALEAAGFALLESATPAQAALYLKSFPLLAVLIDARDGASASAAESAGALAQAETAAARPPLAALARAETSPEALAALVNAGVAWVWFDSAPAELLLNFIRAAQTLAGAGGAESQPGSGAAELARETRKLLHDLCQPLSALQGRLQLMASRCAEDDPLKEQMKNMAAMTLEMSKYVREIQELQRKHS